jgi:thiamine biosynthesis lipoprotein
MSTYIPDSELSLINSSTSTEWIPVSSQLYDVLFAAQQVSRQTDGAFDITVGPLVNLWGFGPDKVNRPVPAAEDIATILPGTGYRQLELRTSPPAVKKHHPSTYLDLSGIAKGYAVDRIAALLEKNGINRFMVEIGGEIRARGSNQREETWRVGIEKPLIDQRAVEVIIHLPDTGMATSGDYRNFFMHDGRRYSHTIDPATGWPVSHDLTSVSVLDDSAMMADALATALMVMGPDLAWRFAEDRNIPALFIINSKDEFTEKHTTSFSPYLIE